MIGVLIVIRNAAPDLAAIRPNYDVTNGRLREGPSGWDEARAGVLQREPRMSAAGLRPWPIHSRAFPFQAQIGEADSSSSFCPRNPVMI
jgi:hypothetical protein